MTRIGVAAAAGAALTVAAITLVGPGATQSSWAQMVEMVQAASKAAPCVHLQQRVWTSDREDFFFVELDGQPVTMEAWICWPREGGDPGRARVEKKNRIYLFDGRQTIHYRPQVREATRIEGGRPRLELFWPAAWLANLVQLPTQEVEVIQRDEAAGRLDLRLRAPEMNGLPPAFFEDFDREIEIRWDPATRKLTGFTSWVLVNGERRLYSELLSIDYPPYLSDDIFQLDLPADVRWTSLPEAPAQMAALGPREAAEQFWTAAIRGDWGTVALFCPTPSTIEWMQRARPLELLELGDPVSKGSYPGVFVPYKVRYADRVRELRIALRNDNPELRWVVDGGI